MTWPGRASSQATCDDLGMRQESVEEVEAMPGGIPGDTLNELRRVARVDAIVSLLGGEAVVSGAIEEQMSDLGYRQVRLVGATRIETSVEVAGEVRRLYPDRTAVAVARADGPVDDPTASWDDSLAWQQPRSRTLST